jgi:phosphatidate cytidylyltransferase
MEKENQQEVKKSKIKDPNFWKRTISSAIILPVMVLLLIFANNIVMDIFLAALSTLCFYEYSRCFKKTNKANPSSWLGYIVCFGVAFVHLVDTEIFKNIIIALIPTILFILMVEMLFNEEKKNVMDIFVTFVGILYIPVLIAFFSVIRNRMGGYLGHYLVWYIFIAAWASDVFAFMVGTRIGKHKFTKISPKKSVEGCIAGIIGADVVAVIYTLIINNGFNQGINIGLAIVVVSLLTIIGQVGDVFASAIKRYCGIKDFSNLIPGHGGMLDRVDSVIFVIPFAYILLSLLI